MSKRTNRINEQIHAPQVRVIGESGQQLGVMSVREALQAAQERNLDLVEVAPNADPPVCRILDFGKFQYERAKKEKEARRAQKQIEVKEVRLRPKTGEHDIQVVLRKMRSFLQDGAKVKVRIRFRGREVTHPGVAQELMERLIDEVDELAVVEQRPSMEGNSMLMVLAPSRQ